jgi:hypothetical protein
MSVAVVTCPNCGFRFNYHYVPSVSLTALRIGGARSFRCPQCHERAIFDLSIPGPDADVRTYDDPLGVNLAAALGIAIGCPILIFVWLMVAPSGPDSFWVVAAVIGAMVVGLASILGYGLYRGEPRSRLPR